MIQPESVRTIEKACVIWSERQQQELALRVSYDVREQDGCRIYVLRSMEPSK
jgi:hypothetical protein